jgi:citrate lyase subunit beta/citryl-CoA lyase
MAMTRLHHVVAPLFVPANRPERFAKAAESGADAVILDLEDAVAPEVKDLARERLRTNFTSLPVIVRINAAATPWHALDLSAVKDLPVAGVMVPKAESLAALEKIGSVLGEEASVVALIETAQGLAECRRIALVPAVKRLAFGSIDFCADIGCAHSREALLAARWELVLASRLAGLQAPLDGVTTTIDDAVSVTDDARHARSLGFGGKLCIHPRQVEHVLAGFRPDEAEIAWARKVLAGGSGAVAVDGAMVDEPVRMRARSILKRSAHPHREV